MALVACDVCLLLDNDSTPKDCKYCRICKAWLCAEDFKSLTRRTQAFLKRELNG